MMARVFLTPLVLKHMMDESWFFEKTHWLALPTRWTMEDELLEFVLHCKAVVGRQVRTK